jgi:two-component system sensor histidine kinase UhpB
LFAGETKSRYNYSNIKKVKIPQREHTMNNSNIPYEEGVQNNRLLRPFLGIPVFYKVLLANSLIIFVGASGGTWLASQLHSIPNAPVYLILFVTLGWLVSVILNFVVLQIAFRPLLDLGKVMKRVQTGERTLRAQITGVDPEADQLASTFNTMLEGIDEANRVRASQIIKAQEQERKRIARELHDETSQVLTSLLISLAVLEESTASQEGRDRIAETRRLAHQTLRAVRNLSIDLRPSALDDLGLLPALRWYVKEYQQKTSLEVEFHATGFKDRERLSPEMETALYRIVQESLTNIAKHAQAHKVTITLHEETDFVDATIADDGRGFRIEEIRNTADQDRGLGLVGMQERALLLDGTVDIDSKPGQGTLVQVHIPLRAVAVPRRETAAELVV